MFTNITYYHVIKLQSVLLLEACWSFKLYVYFNSHGYFFEIICEIGVFLTFKLAPKRVICLNYDPWAKICKHSKFYHDSIIYLKYIIS